MNKLEVARVSEIEVSAYYGIKDSLTGHIQWGYHGLFKSGPLYQKYWSMISLASANVKPWTSINEGLGYTLINQVLEANADTYPAKDEYPLIVEGSKGMSSKEFNRLRREGRILATSLLKSKFTVEYLRGTVISDSPISDWVSSKWSTRAEDDSGMEFWQGGNLVVIQGYPSIRQQYRLVEANTNVHPFDVGYIRHQNVLPRFVFDEGLITKVLADAESGTYDLLTEIAEFPSTLEFLNDVLKSASKKTKEHIATVKHYTELLRKATGKFAEKIAKKLAGAWLAYRYAIMPIKYSIDDIRATLENYKRVFAKFRGKEPQSCEFEIPGFHQESFADMTYRCWIKRGYDPLDLIDELLGVLKVNPFATAWELVTLSFVVDWFINIGDVITAYTGNKAYVDQAATISRKIEGTAVYVSGSVSDCAVRIKYEHYDRRVIDPRDYIGLSLEFDLTWKQKIDAIALLTQPTIDSLKKIRKTI